MTKNQQHTPVLLKEVIDFLKPKEGDVLIDGTLGLGGHSEAILDRIGEKGLLLALDRDSQAIKFAKQRLAGRKNLIIHRANFDRLEEICEAEKIKDADGILVDLGVSSLQIDSPERGFSFKKKGPLDMRMGEEGITAEEIVNGYSERELANIFKIYGEEIFAKQIARKIVEKREESRIEDTLSLREAVVSALPKKYVNTSKKDPATKVFQALRLEVNRELKALGGFLPQATSILKKGGRLAVISFHSLEDKIVKDFFKDQSKGCICPRDFPVCRCQIEPSLRVITKKPTVPGENEIKENPRSRSAKLRVAERINN